MCLYIVIISSVRLPACLYAPHLICVKTDKDIESVSAPDSRGIVYIVVFGAKHPGEILSVDVEALLNKRGIRHVLSISRNSLVV